MIVLNSHWLSEWVGAPIDHSDDVAAMLLTQGFELDEPAPLHLDQIIVGEITVVTPHKNADKLNVCSVAVGENRVLQIVCGCSSVRVGVKVAVAMVGTDLGGFVIEKRALRGVESHGMLCSLDELGFKTHSGSIWHLHSEAPVGMQLNEWLNRSSHRFGIEITPNRGDCLSVRGMAREFALGLSTSSSPPWQDDLSWMSLPEDGQITVSSEVADSVRAFHLVKCQRAKHVSTVPDWMTVRLLEAGFSLHHPVVNILNYAMLETGQPFHAYSGALSNDFHLSGGDNQSLQLLNDDEVVIDDKTLVINNDGKPACIAGYMGGLSSASQPDDEYIYVEAACFIQEQVAYHCRRYVDFTQSGSRFERGIDVGFVTSALQRALDLLEKYAGFTAVSRSSLSVNAPRQHAITVPSDLPQRVLGFEYAQADLVSAWERSGCHVTRQREDYTIVPPSWRNDMRIPQDMVSEALRLLGMPNQLSSSIQLPIQAVRSEHEEVDSLSDDIRQLLVGMGFCESYTYTFDDVDSVSVFSESADDIVTLRNPISPAYSALRTTIFPGLFKQVKRNLAQQHQDIRLFELGRCFANSGDQIHECDQLAAVMTGRTAPENWSNDLFYDFYYAKDLLCTLFRKQGVDFNLLQWRSHPVAGLHPHQSGQYLVDGRVVATCGLLHPAVAKPAKIVQSIYFISCDLSWLFRARQSVNHYRSPSKYPLMRRDLSLLVPTHVCYEQIQAEIRSGIFQNLKKIVIFDQYHGSQIPDGFYSISIGLLFQHPQRTLQDDELNPMLAELLSRLEEKFEIKQRGG
jgi:phenylalanyl-tRNA synthetase beta chain